MSAGLRKIYLSFVLVTLLMVGGKGYADSLNVRQLGSLWLGFNVVHDCAIVGNYAYVAASGLSIVNITRPDSMFEVGYCAIGGANALKVVGNYAYVACGFGLVIVNIMRPDSPRVSGFTVLGHDTSGVDRQAWGISLIGNYAFVTNGDSGLYIVNIANPASPQIIGNCRIPGEANSIVINGNYAYVTNAGNGFSVIDISDSGSPRVVGTFSHAGAGESYGIAVSANYAFVATYNSALRIVNISNPLSPQEVGSFPTLNAFSVTISGNYAFIGLDYNWGETGRLVILDISNPISPRQIGFYDTDIGISSVFVSGNYAYAANINNLEIFDCSQSLSIFESSHSSIPTIFSLEKPYPNPFNPITTISFSLPIHSPVNLTIYDALGREVTSLLSSQSLTAGTHSLSWNAQSYPSGTYFLRMNAGTFTQSRKLLLLK